MAEDEFSGKLVLVTGAGSGIGLAIAGEFAARGARVVINDIRTEAAEAAAAGLGAGHRGIGGDVTDADDVQAMIAACLASGGRIDVVVNNAGIAESGLPSIDASAANFRHVLDVHVSGTFLVSQAAARPMLAQGGGVMINISSLAGLVGIPGRPAYSAAKAGIAMLTRTLACEWASGGIRVNAIAPGYIVTPLLQSRFDAGLMGPETLQRRTPMGVLGRPDDVAKAAAFLASENARYITGVTLPVDGGYTAWGGAGDAFGRTDLPPA